MLIQLGPPLVQAGYQDEAAAAVHQLARPVEDNTTLVGGGGSREEEEEEEGVHPREVEVEAAHRNAMDDTADDARDVDREGIHQDIRLHAHNAFGTSRWLARFRTRKVECCLPFSFL